MLADIKVGSKLHLTWSGCREVTCKFDHYSIVGDATWFCVKLPSGTKTLYNLSLIESITVME